MGGIALDHFIVKRVVLHWTIVLLSGWIEADIPSVPLLPGTELVREELVEDVVLIEPGPGGCRYGTRPGSGWKLAGGGGMAPPPFMTASVCATQVEGSMRRTGSCRGTMK